MLRTVLLSFCFIAISCAWTQENKEIGGKSFLSGQFVGAENQTVLFGCQQLGGVRNPLAKIPLDDQGKFSFEYDLKVPDYYFLVFENNQILNLVLRGNDTIKIYGDARDIMNVSNIVGSEDSEIMNQFVVTWTAFNSMKDSLVGVLRVDPSKQTEVDEYFKPLAQEFYMKRNNLINRFGDSPAIVATLNAIDQENEWDTYQQVVHLLTKSFPNSLTVQSLAKYTNQKIAERERTSWMNPGNPAMDIALPDPQGDTIRLSDLKGQVVLLDFWASWCKPCRLENPNVVSMYQKYGKEGFTVYSVSLDNNRDKWLAAISKDKLSWPNHVSDLKGWKSAGGAIYGVKSIPFTVLIDREGNIVGTNIRGPELENQLKAIFGH